MERVLLYTLPTSVMNIWLITFGSDRKHDPKVKQHKHEWRYTNTLPVFVESEMIGVE